MCGLVYAHNVDGTPVNNDVLDTFDSQRNRGLEGFGLFDGQENNIVREVKEDGILKWLVKYDSNLILFHHRLPTSTDNVRKAAHPFATKKFFGKNQYILAHNGMISNSRELKTAHEKLGIKYQSVTKDGRFNDSEALLWDFALTMEGRQEKLTARGGIAFICVQLTKGKLKRLLFGRNNNPLNMKITDLGVRLSSEGVGVAIVPDQLYEYDYKNNSLSKKDFDIPGYAVSNYNAPYTGSYARGWNWQNENYHASTTYPVVQKSKTSVPGDWLPDYLRHKYHGMLDKLAPIGDDQVLDYDRDGNPIYPSDLEYDSYDEYYADRQSRVVLGPKVNLSEDKEEEAEAIVPDEVEVWQTVAQYLTLAEGNFEHAYFLAEADYEELFDVPEAEQDRMYLEQVRTLELVMSEINSDPEYVNEHSVSSSWLPTIQQLLPV